jgi:hypothetical protein
MVVGWSLSPPSLDHYHQSNMWSPYSAGRDHNPCQQLNHWQWLCSMVAPRWWLCIVRQVSVSLSSAWWVPRLQFCLTTSIWTLDRWPGTQSGAMVTPSRALPSVHIDWTWSETSPWRSSQPAMGQWDPSPRACLSSIPHPQMVASHYLPLAFLHISAKGGVQPVQWELVC